MIKLTQVQIETIERELGVKLAAFHRQLLMDLGVGELVGSPKSEWNGSQEIYHPESIRSLFEEFFEDPSMIFSRYVPIGCDNGTQEIWVIDQERSMAASISHETVPDDWPEEEWVSCEQWAANTIGKASKA